MSSFFENNPNLMLDQIVCDIIVEHVVAESINEKDPFYQYRVSKCKQLIASYDAKQFVGDLTLKLNLGDAFRPSFVPVWEFVSSNNRRQSKNYTPEQQTHQAAMFTSSLSVLRRRREHGDAEAGRALDEIERDAKARKTEKQTHLYSGNRSSLETSKSVQTSEEIAKLADELGGEIKQEILTLVLSMRMSPEDQVNENDIAGLKSVRKLIREKIIYPIRRPDLHHGLHQPPRGKTMIAKWIATESGANFFEVTPSCLISKFYGETETIIRGLFIVAEYYSPSVIFIDEVDSLLGKRRERDDDSSIRMKNQLLQMMDGIKSNQRAMVVIVAATNRPDMLDDAALRRLSKRVLVPLPDVDARKGQFRSLLIKHHQALHHPNPSLSAANSNNLTQNDFGLSDEELQSIAEVTEGWNGSDLKSLTAKASDYSYDEALQKYGGVENIPNIGAFRSIQYSDFLQALKDVHPSSLCLSNDTKESLREWEKNFGCS